jgi:hypothetical protein
VKLLGISAKRVGSALALLCVAVSCLAQQQVDGKLPLTERGYRESLRPLVGKQIEEVIAEWGSPRAVYEPDSRTAVWRYLWLRNEGTLQHQGETIPTSCATRLLVNSKREVVSFFFDGNSCKAEDRSLFAGSPTFTITATGRIEDATTLQVFSVIAFLGSGPLPIQAGCGSIPKGHGVPARCVGSELPVRPMRLRLRGTYKTDTPEQEAARRANGTFLELEGEVDLVPVAGHQYIVTGTLSPGQSAVWIEDSVTKQPATEIVRAAAK